MALSEDEQRRLEQLEASLVEDDPTLAHAMRGTRPHRRLPTSLTIGAGVGFVVGMAMLVSGIGAHWTISVLGFVVMLASAVVGLGLWRPTEADEDSDDRPSATPGEGERAASTHLIDRLEERWRHRDDDSRS